MLKILGITTLYLIGLPLINAPDVTGRWDGVVGTPSGKVSLTYYLKEEKGKLAGTMLTDKGAIAIEDGMIDNAGLSFRLKFGGFTIAHRGTVEKDTLYLTLVINERIMEGKFLRARESGNTEIVPTPKLK